MMNHTKNEFKIVSREEWGAEPLGEAQPLDTPVSELVVFSETGTDWCYTQDECSGFVKKLQTTHKEQGMSDIQYNFMLAMDGRAYEGTGWQQGTNIPGREDLNGKHISIAYIGIYEDWKKPARLQEITEKLLKIGIEQNFISENYNKTDIRCGNSEITEVMNIIEDKTKGLKSLHESHYI